MVIRNESVAKRIAFYRRKLGYSQIHLADRLGVSVGTVRAWEKGSNIPRLSSARVLSELFDAPITEFTFENAPDFSKSHPISRRTPFDC